MADTLNKFGVPIDGTRAGILMPKPKHKFRVRFTNFGPLNSHQTVDLSRQVMTCDRPKVSYNPVTVHSYNSVAYYAGKHEWQAISLSVRDDVTNAVSKLVGFQIQKQLNHFEQTSPLAGSNYKFTMTYEVMDGGNEGILETWTLEGCFLADINYDGGDYASADPLMITMQVRYDNATLSEGLFPDVGEIASNLLDTVGV
ncbi:MAG: hypothetical protein HC836_32850 [Richelia sp. RM2_1_2]|nr:hypothetical protein [Richelia sp. RM2_1_2]